MNLKALQSTIVMYGVFGTQLLFEVVTTFFRVMFYDHRLWNIKDSTWKALVTIYYATIYQLIFFGTLLAYFGLI